MKLKEILEANHLHPHTPHSTTLKATNTPETIENPLNNPQPSPEEKTRLTIEMTEAVTAICADGIKANNPDMTEEEVITELRRRITQERR